MIRTIECTFLFSKQTLFVSVKMKVYTLNVHLHLRSRTIFWINICADLMFVLESLVQMNRRASVLKCIILLFDCRTTAMTTISTTNENATLKKQTETKLTKDNYYDSLLFRQTLHCNCSWSFVFRWIYFYTNSFQYFFFSSIFFSFCFVAFFVHWNESVFKSQSLNRI